VSPPSSVPLERIAESVDYGVTASAAWEGIGPKFLRITDIQDGRVDWGKVPWCECSERELASARLEPGDIVFARTGATTGKSYLIRECPEVAVFASYLIRVRLGDKAYAPFVSHYFQTVEYWAQISSNVRGVAQPGLNATTLMSLRIPVPPLEEQRRIAAILDQAETLRTQRRQALAHLDTLTQSLFLDMFGDPVVNPKGFVITTLADVSKFENGDRSSNYPSGDDIKTEGVLFLSTKNIVASKLDLSKPQFITQEKFESLGRGKARSGDLIITLRGTLGSCCIFDCEEETAFINAQMMIIRPTAKVICRYLHSLLTSDEAKAHFDYIGRGAAVPQLTAGQLGELKVLLPPLPLQQTFATRIQAIESLKATHRAALAQLDALFASLQQRAFAEGL